ncbi:MAG: hypothetical protein JWN73_3417 [Betaproteobacteria bacterium]|nr:hypothetical protein [Betaproteobacteria bacterium]
MTHPLYVRAALLAVLLLQAGMVAADPASSAVPGAAANPPAVDLAGAAAQALIGFWKVDARSRVGRSAGQLEYRADGSWELSLYTDAACKLRKTHAWGTWEVIDQRLVTRIVESDADVGGLHPGLRLVDDIVRVNERELVLRFQGRLVYRSRGQECPGRK